MPKFILAPCVGDELWAIWTFIARDNPEAADRVIESAYETFQNLAKTPSLGRIRKFDNPRLKEVRSWHISGFDDYLIFIGLFLKESTFCMFITGQETSIPYE